MPGKFFQAPLFRRQKIPPHLSEKPYIHWHLLRTTLAKVLGYSEWNSRLTENSPICFPGDEMFMSKNSRAKIDLNFLRPSPCTDKKWKSPLLVQQCRHTKVEPFDIPSQQCGNVCDQNDHTKFVFWFLSNISAQQMYSWWRSPKLTYHKRATWVTAELKKL